MSRGLERDARVRAKALRAAIRLGNADDAETHKRALHAIFRRSSESSAYGLSSLGCLHCEIREVLRLRALVLVASECHRVH